MVPLSSSKNAIVNEHVFTDVAVVFPKACRTRELSAELTVTREHWRKQVPPVCGKILKDFWHA